MTLLKNAQKRPVKKRNTRRDISREDIEIALAWVRGEVRLADVEYAYEKETGIKGNVYSRIARSLRAHILEQGL